MESQKLVYVWGYDMWVHKSCFDESEKGWTTGGAAQRLPSHAVFLQRYWRSGLTAGAVKQGGAELSYFP